ncbi:hypothetical protein SynWH8103_00798 [Synechococcus sp. WH 8103]|nr:hypothetical protein SynWH8103_00798 [Synechococcus sp. WH 8103]
MTKFVNPYQKSEQTKTTASLTHISVINIPKSHGAKSHRLEY